MAAPGQEHDLDPRTAKVGGEASNAVSERAHLFWPCLRVSGGVIRYSVEPAQEIGGGSHPDLRLAPDDAQLKKFLKKLETPAKAGAPGDAQNE